MLVPDATAMPVGFHDMIENISNMPDFRARMVAARDITSLRRCWPSSLFVDMHRRQAEMETLRRACKKEFDSEFGGGRAGTCPHCRTYVLCNLSHHIMDYHLELGLAFGLERDRPRLCGSRPTWRGYVGGAQDAGKVLSSLDGDTRNLA